MLSSLAVWRILTSVGFELRKPGLRCASEAHNHRYLGSVIFAFLDTLTMTLRHKTRFNTSGQGLKKTLFAINAIFTIEDSIDSE